MAGDCISSTPLSLSLSSPLQTINLIAQSYAAACPSDFSPLLDRLSLIPSSPHSPHSLSSSALHCIASLASSLSSAILPSLPSLMPRLFSASERASAAAAAAVALSRLPGGQASSSSAGHAAGSAGGQLGSRDGAEEEEKKEAEEGDDFLLEEGPVMVGGEANSDRTTDLGVGSSKRDSALEFLSASLSTLQTMLQAAGPLLSPFLPSLIALSCLRPTVLSCPHQPVVTAAAAIRQLLVKQFHVRDSQSCSASIA